VVTLSVPMKGALDQSTAVLGHTTVSSFFYLYGEAVSETTGVQSATSPLKGGVSFCNVADRRWPCRSGKWRYRTSSWGPNERGLLRRSCKKRKS